MFSPAFITLALFGVVGLCKVYEDVADLPTLRYDFVVVGGGTAGNVVANRLTENPNVSVLVLEAGPSNEGVLDSEVPFFMANLLTANAYNWNYTTTPQSGLNGRTIGYGSAHILGGGSAHSKYPVRTHITDGMVYSRGAQDDFDRYAALTGDEGWSWKQILPYFLKSEKWTPPEDQHDTQGQFDPSVHGRDGPISVSLTGFPWSELEGRVIQTTKELPDDFPFNLDMNSGQPLGIVYMQSTIGGGERSTSATGYLAPKFIQRPNLHVLLHAQVSKLVNVTQHQGKPGFGGVQFRYGTSLFVAEASKEIILSAGSIGTPQILLNSGVGDHTALEALGLPTVLDLPSVGQNASDHGFVGADWAVNSNQTIESITQNTTRFDQAFEQWNTSRTGPFVDALGTHIAWLRLAADSPAFETHADPSPGPGAPTSSKYPGGITGGVGHFVGFALAMVSPVSRGSVTLSSSDPFATPLIDPGLLADDFDMIALTEGVALIQKFLTAAAWNGYMARRRMSPRGAQHGVVDPDLTSRVLRPIVPGAHTQAATYAVAERGADLVKKRWTL
ncbi:aryl-alcohol oxidase precursor [Mycena rosella]|uniref:Aryl-alcohol oxidase n=1 Tax=Mycena rosella TaxID=1033263 RepID=A0AAD7D506_MYCRO|nr:aryl-alcohol oxidase precursor [Mycena rosella]